MKYYFIRMICSVELSAYNIYIYYIYTNVSCRIRSRSKLKGRPALFLFRFHRRRVQTTDGHILRGMSGVCGLEKKGVTGDDEDDGDDDGGKTVF